MSAADQRLLASFEGGTLPPDAMTHAMHVHLAWLSLRERPLLTTLPRFSDALRRFAAGLGAAEKYHETITWAFLLLIHERIARAPEAAWDDFAAANPDLFARGCLERYYRPETLASPLARRVFLLPDRLDQALA
ncbi:MAG: hypothetical protein U0166_26935 [Acidobacteriota bacterium]